ncbi:MAG: hypothetical protein FWE82_09930, partial [Defluviitaleaceae bacterium]|nr:hypothetical protein [Defluviitaleaceae bacterium]
MMNVTMATEAAIDLYAATNIKKASAGSVRNEFEKILGRTDSAAGNSTGKTETNAKKTEKNAARYSDAAAAVNEPAQQALPETAVKIFETASDVPNDQKEAKAVPGVEIIKDI